MPKSLRSLRDRLMHVSRRGGLAFGRLQQHVGVLVVAQFMASLTDGTGQPHILVKGESALELRRGISLSRTSRDLDAVTRDDIEVICRRLAELTSQGWEGFTAVLTEPEVINVPGLAVKQRRFTVKLKYRGAPFVSVPVEVAPVEAGNTDAIDWAQSLALALVGLSVSQPIPCMTVAWQIAQKLHAVTAVLPEGRLNDRAHDLVDLQILEALIADEPLHPVRQACLRSSMRELSRPGRQPWPSTLTGRGYTTRHPLVPHRDPAG